MCREQFTRFKFAGAFIMFPGSTPAAPQHLTLQEFIAISRLSASTIHRLKDAGKIPFIQPAGNGGKLLFPVNAIELMATRELDRPSAPAAASGGDGGRLSGPRPKWTQAPKHG